MQHAASAGLRRDLPRAALRGFAIFLGMFAVVNVLRSPESNLWWIDLRPLPPGPASIALGVAGAMLAAWGLRPAPGRPRRIATVAAAAGLALVAAWNGAGVLALRADGSVEAGLVPLSFVLSALLGVVAFEAWRRRCAAPVPRWAVAASALACAFVFPLAQQATFGRSDYRRDAGAIVVFGARAYADGRASVALADRVNTACDVWREAAARGPAPVLFLSGGPGDGEIHETATMRRLALEAGVADASIVTDEAGVRTLATVENAAQWARANGVTRVLAVSHAYHLPRVRLEFDRAGVEAFTVPAHESRILLKMPWFAAREVAGWWAAWAVRPDGRDES